VLIEITHCGICHSDIHSVRGEWGPSNYPLVPGHEIVGRVSRVGRKVRRFRAGDHVGVGCFVESCRKCPQCKAGEEQFCEKGAAFTYGGTLMDRKTVTQGGYSTWITVDQDYVLKINQKLPLDRVAPLLCAGITTYSPLKRFGVKKGMRVGVVGLGGLGHMGVKLASSMGARVSVFSTSASKQADAKRLGAKDFYITKDPAVFEKLAGQFDFILDTVSAPHDLNAYLSVLKRDGEMTLVGAPPEAMPLNSFSLIFGRHKLGGSLIGGIRETQEMLDYCARKKILSDIELIPGNKINEAYERTLRSDVKYRFVIDCKSL
jgi:uncharacterized zinc-type alcohol dehydrogenase-like protein